MRLNTRTCIGLVIALAVAVALVWSLNRAPRADRSAAVAPAAPPIALTLTNFAAAPATAAVSAPVSVIPGRFAVVATNFPNAPFTNVFAHRLTNSALPFEELLRSDSAVLLRNALIDTRQGAPAIPAHLRAAGDPGAYIVQARGVITDEFRAALRRAGAEIVSYVPNNAYLVRASAGAAQDLRSSPLLQAVLPFEPYYKMDARLLALAVNEQLSPHALLNVVTFPHGAAAAQAALEKMGAEVVAEPESTVFGDVLVVKAGANRLADVAQISEVQMVGVNYEKRILNDLSRVIVRVSQNTTSSVPVSHYPIPTSPGRLTGDGIQVGINDSGFDPDHPDFATDRMTGLSPDFDGHGTHVAGTLLGNGAASSSVGVTIEVTGCTTNNGTNVTGCVTNLISKARGSVPNANFSGMAPRALGFMQDFTLPDTTLQRNTALTNILISNNSWGRPGVNDYDIYAASFDAAVRDSLPGVTGEQEVMYVFAAGNAGGGGANGLNGIPGSVISPSTAKNVITVGASDLPRFITNEVSRACVTDTNTGITVCETNRPWYGMTDTNNEVSPYSSRGNVGIGVEGQYGRFKPDVIAPGSMLVSARSKDYVEPDGITNTYPFRYNGLALGFNQSNLLALVIPPNAISFVIATITNSLSPTNLTLEVGAYYDAATVLTGVNGVRVDGSSTPALTGGVLYYTIANNFHTNGANFDLVLLLSVTNDVGDYFTVLKKLNEPLKPYYRYEAGTSMAAPVVSGMLALLQEHFTNQFQARPSPALLKAMLINGARTLSFNYDFQPGAAINHQGWGLVSMSNMVPVGFALGSNGPMRVYDQTLTNALSTGDTDTYTVPVPPQARSFPLRLTLVWTDPPGNPITGIKLVNDLNLTVRSEVADVVSTNTITNYWVGNNFPVGSDFTTGLTAPSGNTNQPGLTNILEAISVARDIVNNVENIYIRPPLASSYTVEVKGHRVNVNAVNSHLTKHAQDYALVISSGNLGPSNNVNLAIAPPVQSYDPIGRLAALTPVRNTNMSNSAARASLANQRVGANNPLIVSTNGATNQWCFYTYQNVNDPTYTNVIIRVFLAPNLSLARNRDADIDLYVSRGVPLVSSNWAALDDVAVTGSRRSLSRSGSEFVYYNDAGANEVFYIGVKSEDQQAANFSIYAESRNGPFSVRGSNGIVSTVYGPFIIPDGTPDEPRGTTNTPIFITFAPEDAQFNVSRVYVTNAVYHEEAGDLTGILQNTDDAGTNVTLFNHRTWTEWENPMPPFGVVYDDAGLGDLGTEFTTPPVRLPDGPGSLVDFVGETIGAQWLFTAIDNALFHTGFVQEVTLVIEPSSTNNDPNVVIDRVICVPPGGWRYEAVNIDSAIFNMEICLYDFENAPARPIAIYVRQGARPDFGSFDHLFSTLAPGACFNIGLGDNPPLTPGRWFIGYYNSNTTVQCFHERVTLSRRAIPGPYSIYTATNMPKTLLDDATTNSTIFISQTGRIADLRVGLHVKHERAADLAFHLRSPRGTRTLLFENRGRTNQLGIGAAATNVVTNVFRTLINDGFDLHPSRDPFGQQIIVGPPAVISGWEVEGNNIDIFCCGAGITGPSHSGSNGMDLAGTAPNGAIGSNVTTTIVGQQYRLSYAFVRHPFSTPTTRMIVEVNSQPVVTNSSSTANGYSDLKWATTSLVFRATSTSTKIGFRQSTPSSFNSGMYLDTIKLEHVEFITNLFIYTTFTEDTNLTVTPIKFGVAPFTNSPNPQSTLLLNDGFEFISTNLIGAAELGIQPPTVVSGWVVESGSVDLHSGVYNAPHTGIYSLDSSGYNPGRISTNIFTDPGADYLLTFAYLKNDAPSILSAQANVSLDGGTVLTNLLIIATNGFEWTVTSAVFTAQSPVTKLTLDSLTPGDGGVVFDTFTIRKLTPPLAADRAFFLPEEPLTPFFGEPAFGPWTLEVWDSRLGAAVAPAELVSWRLEVSYPQRNPPLVVLTNQLVYTNTVRGDETLYFSVPVTCPAGIITNTLRNITGAGGLDLTFNQFTLPTNSPNDVLLLNNVFGTRQTNLTIGTPPLALAVRYYLAVRNTDPTQTNQFELRFDEVCATNSAIIIDTNGLCLTNTTVMPPNSRQLFTYTMPPGVVAVRFETYNADGNVDLFARAGLNPPIPGLSGLSNLMAGTAGEVIQTTTNTSQNPVTPGPWTLLVTNNEARDVNYCLRITEIYPSQITRIFLGGGTNANVGAGGTEYFVVNVDLNYCSLSFNTGVSHTPPLDLWLYAAFGRLPLANDLFGAGMPAAVSAPTSGRIGDWFVSVVNTNAVAVNYTVQVSPSALLCPTPFSPVLKANSSSYTGAGFQLRWSADASEQFQVLYTESLAPAVWQTNPAVITSGDGNFEFLDTGATTNVQRFYRLQRVP